MGLYRCAACGSPNVMSDTQTGGIKYDFVKGAVGTIALGAGGAVAGITNQQQRVFKCPDCGVTLTYPMPEEIKQAIDLGVMSATAREHFQIHGVEIPWNVIKEQYVNIEHDSEDEWNKLLKSHTAEMNKYKSSELQLIRRIIIENIEDFQSELSHIGGPEDNFEELQAAWELNAQARQREYNKAKTAIQDKCDKAVARIIENSENEKAKLSNHLRELKEEQDSLQAEFSTLNFLKRQRKKEIDNRLNQIALERNSVNEQAKELSASVSELREKQKQKSSSEFLNKKAQIDKQYPLEANPAEHREMLRKKEKYIHDNLKDSHLLSKIVLYEYIKGEIMLLTYPKGGSICFTDDPITAYSDTDNTCCRPASDVAELYDVFKDELSSMLGIEVFEKEFAGRSRMPALIRVRGLTHNLYEAGFLGRTLINHNYHYYPIDKNLQDVVSDVDTSAKKSGQIGDRPYARGRSFDPSHYGE